MYFLTFGNIQKIYDSVVANRQTVYEKGHNLLIRNLLHPSNSFLDFSFTDFVFSFLRSTITTNRILDPFLKIERTNTTVLQTTSQMLDENRCSVISIAYKTQYSRATNTAARFFATLQTASKTLRVNRLLLFV